jgi:hypothetical protein
MLTAACLSHLVDRHTYFLSGTIALDPSSCAPNQSKVSSAAWCRDAYNIYTRGYNHNTPGYGLPLEFVEKRLQQTTNPETYNSVFFLRVHSYPTTHGFGTVRTISTCNGYTHAFKHTQHYSLQPSRSMVVAINFAQYCRLFKTLSTPYQCGVIIILATARTQCFSWRIAVVCA